jgi:hypothetical protein
MTSFSDTRDSLGELRETQPIHWPRFLFFDLIVDGNKEGPLPDCTLTGRNRAADTRVVTFSFLYPLDLDLSADSFDFAADSLNLAEDSFAFGAERLNLGADGFGLGVTPQAAVPGVRSDFSEAKAIPIPSRTDAPASNAIETQPS